MVASEMGRTEVVKLLLDDLRSDPNSNSGYAIGYASKNGHTDVVKLLLNDARVLPQIDDDYALRRAAQFGHTDIVKLLLEDSRVNPNARNNEAIKLAHTNGHTNIVDLLSCRIDFNNIKDVNILTACKKIIDSKITLYVSDYFNRSPHPTLDNLRQCMREQPWYNYSDQNFSQTVTPIYNDFLITQLNDMQKHYSDVILSLIPRSNIAGITDEKILATINNLSDGIKPIDLASESLIDIAHKLRKQNIIKLCVSETNFSVEYNHKFNLI